MILTMLVTLINSVIEMDIDEIAINALLVQVHG